MNELQSLGRFSGQVSLRSDKSVPLSFEAKFLGPPFLTPWLILYPTTDFVDFQTPHHPPPDQPTNQPTNQSIHFCDRQTNGHTLGGAGDATAFKKHPNKNIQENR